MRFAVPLKNSADPDGEYRWRLKCLSTVQAVEVKGELGLGGAPYAPVMRRAATACNGKYRSRLCGVILMARFARRWWLSGK